ncbi:hypothetical protein, partial [Salmonella sp. SAL4433]|uniref:hypothetical protein n=1 Tax=Salmonella sp. SAL4433 TaxID=3159888 RepID=UPI00397E1231
LHQFLLVDRLLTAAARLAPADVRRDWLREWRAEIEWARSPRRSGKAVAEHLLLGRCLGAVAHAAWLRWERWRLEMVLQDLTHATRALARRPG